MYSDGSERSFQPKWKQLYSWIAYNFDKDVVLCSYCAEAEKRNYFGLSTKREPAFISKGFSNWKKALEKFQIHEGSDCHNEAEQMKILAATTEPIDEQSNTKLADLKRNNRQIFLKILEKFRFLTRQGLPMLGDSNNGNFIQLLLSEARYDSRIYKWSEKIADKFTHSAIQNECLKLMSVSILRNISKNLKQSKFYTIMADEVTDVSNHEQLVICIRWIDHNFEPHEDRIGFYQVEDIKSETLFNSIKDALNRMGIPLTDCTGQCYDGASNMVGAKTCVATRIKEIEPRALLTHCYGHALQLAVGDTIKSIKLMRDTLAAAFELNKLIKYSPKRERAFNRLREETAPGNSGYRTLYATRWNIRAVSLQSFFDNWDVFQELWDEILEGRVDPEVRGRVVGVQTQIQSFNFFSGIQLGDLVLRHTDNLSSSLQHTYLSCYEAQQITKVCLSTLKGMREEASFHIFFKKARASAQKLEVNDPKLPRKRKVPSRYEDGEAPAEFASTVEEHYRQIFYQTIDMVTNCIRDRFQQRDYTETFPTMENLLLKA